jgi:hypothetical protein
MQGPVLNDISISVLKAVEVTGIRLIRNSDEYKQKLTDELNKTALGHDLLRVSFRIYFEVLHSSSLIR